MLWLLYVLISVILLSLTILIAKNVMPEVKPLVILLYQYLIAIPLVAFYSWFNGASLSSGNPLLLLIGVIYVTAIGSSYIAFSKESISKVSPVVNLKMLVTVILSLVFLSEPFSIQLLAGIGFGVLGVYLLGGES